MLSSGALTRPGMRFYICSTLSEDGTRYLKIKLGVFSATVQLVLLYGCETWHLEAEDIRGFEDFHH